MFFVYVLYSRKDKRFYIGFTKNIERRVKEHVAGRNHTTLRLDSAELIFYEAFVDEKDARRREKYLKTTQGRKGLRYIVRETLESDICPVV